MNDIPAPPASHRPGPRPARDGRPGRHGYYHCSFWTDGAGTISCAVS